MSFIRLLSLLLLLVTTISAECNCTCASEPPKYEQIYFDAQNNVESSGFEPSAEEPATTAAAATITTEEPTTTTEVVTTGKTFNAIPFVEDVSTCEPSRKCYKDSDCDDGRCVGLAVGTCSCSCFPYMTCGTDKGCGGLTGSCTRNYKCDCYTAYKKHGLENLLEAITTFCNIKKCDGQNAHEACFGMPCNAGQCMC
uniref:CC domain-containing protein n=1 Tax=Steinernema glaseri TaxID=37863 RepID=A0A1I7YGL1_9BILA